MDELNPTVREQEIYEEMELTPEMVVARKLVPDLDFDVECEQLILYGVCKECQEK